MLLFANFTNVFTSLQITDVEWIMYKNRHLDLTLNCNLIDKLYSIIKLNWIAAMHFHQLN